MVAWSPQIEPFGLELSLRLAGLARRRLALWADRIFVGNALTCRPPRRLDVVRTEPVYVPDHLRGRYVHRLLTDLDEAVGRVVVCGSGSPRSYVPGEPVCTILRGLGFTPELELAAVASEGGRILEPAALRAR